MSVTVPGTASWGATTVSDGSAARGLGLRSTVPDRVEGHAPTRGKHENKRRQQKPAAVSVLALHGLVLRESHLRVGELRLAVDPACDRVLHVVLVVTRWVVVRPGMRATALL